MENNKALILVVLLIVLGINVPSIITNVTTINATKELRMKYMETAKQCYEDSKANPPLAVICPRVDISDTLITK